MCRINVDCRQSFDREPDDRQINPGEDSVLACRIFDKHRNSQCIWQKDGKPIRIQVTTISINLFYYLTMGGGGGASLINYIVQLEEGKGWLYVMLHHHM